MDQRNGPVLALLCFIVFLRKLERVVGCRRLLFCPLWGQWEMKSATRSQQYECNSTKSFFFNAQIPPNFLNRKLSMQVSSLPPSGKHGDDSSSQSLSSVLFRAFGLTLWSSIFFLLIALHFLLESPFWLWLSVFQNVASSRKI